MGTGKLRIGIVVAEFNYDITYLMLERAREHSKFLGLEIVKIVKAPGVYDTPLLAKALAERRDVDAIVVLGAVIKGATHHDEVVAHQAARKLLDISLETGKPVALGIIGPGASRSQALERVDEYARRAVEAAVKTAMNLKLAKEEPGSGG